LTYLHALSFYGFDKHFAACQLPVLHTISFRRGKRGGLRSCRLLVFGASRHQQAQGRAARASKAHFVPISIFIQYLELRGRTHAFMYASISV
jgi:hypothetical protein